jgi:hypothetical protein
VQFRAVSCSFVQFCPTPSSSLVLCGFVFAGILDSLFEFVVTVVSKLYFVL